MTTKIAAAFAICFLLVVADVEARRYSDHHRRRRNYKKLFVFGDSLADNGNLQRSGLSSGSRGWYYPYGISDSTHGNRATGRFSDGLWFNQIFWVYITCYVLICN
jgi:phospholipase/lecithinase/hemolysin